MSGTIPTLLLALGSIMIFFLKYVVPAKRLKKLKDSKKSKTPQISKEAIYRAARYLYDIPNQVDIIAFLSLNVPTTDADLKTVKAFLQAAAAMKDVPEYKNLIRKRTERKHCVRCHKEYSDATNNESACKIPHAFTDELSDLGKMASFEEKIYTHEALCCKGVELDTIDGDEYVNLGEVGLCFEGRHTAQKLTVELGGGTRYNNFNILECIVDSATGYCTLPVTSENPIIFSTVTETKRVKVSR